MYRSTQRIRKAGVAALVAATALSGLAVFPSTASAAAADATDLTIEAQAQPTVGQGKANQPAGPLEITITPGDTVTAGDQILIELDDADGSSCAAGDTLAVTTLPTVSVTGTATVVPTLETTAAGCGTDRLRLNVTGSGTATINISGINYTVGAAAAFGGVTVSSTLNAVAISNSPVSNAFVSSAVLTANDPPTGADQVSGGSYAISPLVITEQSAAAADGDLCISFSDDIEDTPAPAPTVAVTGGTDTAVLVVDTVSDTIRIDVTPSTPTATTSTFTISGVRLETDDTGTQEAVVFTDDDDNCANGGGAQQSDGGTNVGYVGNATRYGGSDRFATAQILFEEEFSCNDNVIIARADLFPDALAASYLAGYIQTGILLTNTDSVPASTLNALRNEGVNNVYLMGGTTAISQNVATELDATPVYAGGCGDFVAAGETLNIQRVGGDTRYATAQQVAEYPGLDNAGALDINNDGDCSDAATTAIVASGENFPDALAAGPLAYVGSPHGVCGNGEIPLLLSRLGSVPTETLAALTNLGVVNVVVVGGTTAVSDAAVAQLTAAGYNVRRIAGINRMATAAALATAMLSEWDYDSSEAGIARGDNFPDALTAGPFAGDDHYPILLTASPTALSTETANLISSWPLLSGSELTEIDIFGGTAAITNAVVQAALNAASMQ